MGLAFPGGLTGSQRHVARPRDGPLTSRASRIAPTKRVEAMPTTSAMRLISPFRHTSGLAGWILGRWSLGSS